MTTSKCSYFKSVRIPTGQTDMRLATIASLLLSGILGSAVCGAQSNAAVASVDSNNSEGLQEIVVTAQRRRENVQDVPLSVDVVSGEQLTSSGFKSLTDLQYLAPGLGFTTANGGGFQIRGIGTLVFDYSNEQAVGIVIDGVVYDFPRSPGLNTLNDIDHVEVLRGPQGTLFGKNSSAGVISVTTVDPILAESQVKFEGDYGERQDNRVVGTVNLPVGDTVALRVSATHSGQDGFGYDPAIMSAIGDVRDDATRWKLRFMPSSSWDNVLTFQYSHHYDTYPNGTFVSGTPAFVAEQASYGIVVGPMNADVAQTSLPHQDYSNKAVSVVSKYHFDHDYTLTSIAAYQVFDLHQNLPVAPDPSNFFVPYNIAYISANNESEEVRFASPTDQRVRYVVGGFFNRMHLFSTQEQAGTFGQTGLPPDTYLSTVNGLAIFENTVKSGALFANANITLADKFDLVVGGRLTDDDNSSQFGYDSAQTLPYTFIPIGPHPMPSSASVNSTNFSYKVSPTYHIDKDKMLYLTYSTGYKGPGTAFVGGRYAPYKSETVDNYEGGFKSEFFNHTVRFNIDYYYELFKDFQAQVRTIYNGVPTFLINNAPRLVSKGVETEITWQATRRLVLDAGAAYQNAKFADYLYGNQQLAGYPPAFAPEWSVTGSAAYKQPLPGNMLLDLSLNDAYKSTYYQILGDPTTKQTAFSILNAQIGVGPSSDSWKVGVYARNLGNQFFVSAANSFPFGSTRNITNDARRTVGVFVRAAF